MSVSLAPDHARLASAAAEYSLAALFRRSARLFAERTAVVSADVELSYRELDQRTDRLAAALVANGIAQRDRIAVISTTRPEYVEIYVAAAKLGVTVVALNIRLLQAELAYCVELTQPRLLFASPDLSDGAQALARASAGVGRVICFADGGADDSSEYERLLASAGSGPPRVDCDPEDVHCVLFTSGTTGRPKGVMISQRASATRAFRVAHTFELTSDDGLIAWIPMFHTGGDECLQATLMTGGKFATFERLDLVEMFGAIERYRLTWTPMLPGVITEFLRHPNRRDYDLSSFRFGLGYANMMPRIVEEFTSTLNADFWDCFGQTESSFVLALDRVAPGTKPSLRKRPAPLLDVRVVDEAMEELPVGVPGECVVRGPSVMSGYIGNPAATQQSFRGGWLHTGDVLVRHEDGTYSYVDRLSYMIKTGGENVYPAEVEGVLTSHPAIQEACVLGVPDERWGEAIKAVVVLSEGSAVGDAELRDWCQDKLAGFKRPRYVQVLDEADVPRSITGKILRHKLAALDASDQQRA
jgi:fatty-acyl-CoA synthase